MLPCFCTKVKKDLVYTLAFPSSLHACFAMKALPWDLCYSALYVFCPVFPKTLVSTRPFKDCRAEALSPIEMEVQM